MKCCNQSIRRSPLPQGSSIPRIESISTSNLSLISTINSGFKFDSGFCQFCGVDVSVYSHEFWCKLASS